MSQNNSKSKKPKFPNSSSSNIPNPPAQDSSTNPYAPSFKPQAPPTHAPHYHSKTTFPSNSNAANVIYSDSHSISRPSSDKTPPPDPQNLPNYSNISNYMLYFPQAQPPGGQTVPPPRNSNTMEVQPPQYPNFFNIAPQGYPFAPNYPPAYLDPSFIQQDPSRMMAPSQGNMVNDNYMVEEAQKTDVMEIISSNEDNKAYSKRSRKEFEEAPSEFEVLHKKTRTENKYLQKLEVLGNELAKIKESEMQIYKALLTSPHPTVSNLKSRKEVEGLLTTKNALSQTPLLPPNLVIQAALSSLPHEALKSILATFVNGKVKDASELDQIKTEFINETRKVEEETKNGQKIKEEEEAPCKVLHISTQQFYQSNPAIKEYEDRMERLEFLLREKRGKVRETTKKVCEGKIGLEIAQAKYEIATRRLEEMGLLGNQEQKE